MKRPVHRFRITTEAGRVFFVYAPSDMIAVRRFDASPQAEGVDAFDTEPDDGPWTTSMQDGRWSSPRDAR